MKKSIGLLLIARERVACLLSLVALVAVGAACGGPSPPADGATDTGPGADASVAPDAPPRDARPDRPAPMPMECNTVPAPAAGARPTRVAEDRPAPTGGTIVPGRYELTAMTVYTGAGGMTDPFGIEVRETLVVSASTIESVLVDGRGELHFTITYTVNGTEVSWMQACPAGSAGTFAFTADATSIQRYSRLHDGVNFGDAIFRYELRR